MNILDHVEIRVLELMEEKERLSHRLNAIDNSLEIYKAKLIQPSKTLLPVSASVKTPKIQSTEILKTPNGEPSAFGYSQNTITTNKTELVDTEIEIGTETKTEVVESTPKKSRRGRPPGKKKAEDDSKYTPPPSNHKLKHLSKNAAEKRVDDMLADDLESETPTKSLRAEKLEKTSAPEDDGSDLLAGLLGGVDADLRQKAAPEVEDLINSSGEVLLEPKTKKDIAMLIREISLKDDKYRKILNENLKKIIGYDTFASVPDDESATTEIWYSISEWSKTI